MTKHKILFVCVHNSARSQMAEAFLNIIGGDFLEAESAGVQKGALNQYVIEVMGEIGIDISKNETKEVFDLFRQGRLYHAVITVCDAVNAEKCPVFPGMVRRIEWSFPDPSKFQGSKEEILNQTRVVRDQIKNKVADFVSQASDFKYWM